MVLTQQVRQGKAFLLYTGPIWQRSVSADRTGRRTILYPGQSDTDVVSAD
jgi:hypothetical protein